MPSPLQQKNIHQDLACLTVHFLRYFGTWNGSVYASFSRPVWLANTSQEFKLKKQIYLTPSLEWAAVQIHIPHVPTRAIHARPRDFGE